MSVSSVSCVVDKSLVYGIGGGLRVGVCDNSILALRASRYCPNHRAIVDVADAVVLAIWTHECARVAALYAASSA